jgi:hypothetical protein
MQSTLALKQNDDPHDVVAVAPDAVRVAPSDEELSDLLQQAARHRSEALPKMTMDFAATDFAAGPATSPKSSKTIPPAASPTIPPVDTTFRPTAVNGVASSKLGSTVRQAMRGFMALLLAACIGAVAFVWRSHGDMAEKKIAKWATQFSLTALSSPEKPATAPQLAAASPVAQAEAPDAAPVQPTSPVQAAAAQTATEAVAPDAAGASPQSTQLLQSMARDIAGLGQEVEQLKASIEQLKAGQSGVATKASEQNRASLPAPRAKISSIAPPSRSPVAHPRKPAQSFPPSQAAATPALPPTAAPYYAPRPPAPPQQASQAIQPQAMQPRVVQPQISETVSDDPGVSSIPRPPMPLR